MWKMIQALEAPAVRANDAELDAFEARMGLSLPRDHREFLRTFGEGVLFNHFRIFGLQKIESEWASFQSRWQEYFIWGGSNSALTQDHMEHCIILGDTFNGDELVLSRDFAQEIFYLPQDKHDSRRMGYSLESTIAQLASELAAEVVNFPEDERDEWDLRPIFTRENF